MWTFIKELPSYIPKLAKTALTHWKFLVIVTILYFMYVVINGVKKYNLKSRNTQFNIEMKD